MAGTRAAVDVGDDVERAVDVSDLGILGTDWQVADLEILDEGGSVVRRQRLDLGYGHTPVPDAEWLEQHDRRRLTIWCPSKRHVRSEFRSSVEHLLA